jgi:hypothetical protein
VRSGDINFYDVAPWDADKQHYSVPEPKAKNEYNDYVSSLADDDVDHFDFFGVHLLKFDHFERVLKPLNGGGEFKGFTPRWTLPARLRNPINKARASSALMVIVDSKREVDLNMAPHFS